MAATRVQSQDILDGTIVDADVAAANKDGTAGTPSLRTLGTGAQQACAGNDSRLTNDRTANALRTATTVVSISAAAAPTAGQVLTAIDDDEAEWADPTGGTFVDNEVPAGTIDGVNAEFTLASTPIAGSVHLYKNGLRQRPGATFDYEITGDTITFNAGNIPLTGSNLLADYRI